MKKLQLFLIVLITIALLGLCSIPAAAFDVGIWQFNERGGSYAYDSSGNGLTAYINYPFYNGFAPSGSSLFFDGVRSCASVSDDNTSNMNLLNFTASSLFSIEAWVYVPQNQNRWQGVITRGRYYGASSWYGIWISSDNRWVAGSASGNIYGSAVIPQAWHHVVEEQNGILGTLTLYVDGVQVASGPVCNGATSSPLLFGAAGTGEFFYGYLDEVKITNSIVTPQYLTAAYAKYAPAKIANWKFEERPALNIYTYADSTGNRFDANTGGTVQGGVSPGKVGSYCIRFKRQGALWVNVNNDRFSWSRYDNFTVTVWVKIAEQYTSGAWNCIVERGQTGPQWFGLWITPDQHWLFAGHDNSITGSAVTAGWHYIKLVQNGNYLTRYLYVDGVLQGTCESRDVIMGLVNYDFCIGGVWRNGGLTGEFFDGYVDELSVYNYVAN